MNQMNGNDLNWYFTDHYYVPFMSDIPKMRRVENVECLLYESLYVSMPL